ncbi:hypothetical protein ILUMI_16252 [Ignelater luminosus]|uniref:Peptidase S1 domain-containing protein n=1 Tax=Ignelater luminosus TaxID=2038154 RepID=A0A8K0G8Q8_IGNLU|nr:hypothetical protein ILUMI_16252 [Ignelater luminosus]
MLVSTKLFIVTSVLVMINLVLIVVVIIVSPRSCSAKQVKGPDVRIIGGVPVDIRNHQFAAAIVIKKHGGLDSNRLQCGGSILSLKWVVTAAHCLILLEDQKFTKEVVYISAGHSAWNRGYKHEIMAWAYHEDYDKTIMNDDIGLIRVRQSLNKNNEKRISLASIKYKYEAGRQIRVIGWGVTSFNGKISDYLNAVDVYIFKQTYCIYLYGEYALETTGMPSKVTASMFCAGHKEGGRDACQFDSGGPIFDHGLLIGIVSWGVECAVKTQPGVYTRINLYKDWIMKTTKKLNAPLYITNPNDRRFNSRRKSAKTN